MASGHDGSFDPERRGTWRGSARDLVVNGRPRTVRATAGYAFKLADVGDFTSWQDSIDDDWEQEMITASKAKILRHVGTKTIDGTVCAVFETPSKEYVYAQSRHMARNGSSDFDKKAFTVHLDNLDGGDDVSVAVYGDGAVEWAKYDQSIAGSHWEGSEDGDFAYAFPGDHPGLVEELESEGYDLNLDNYSPPDASDDFEDYTRRGIGNILLQWHSGQGDPIYAVGSFFISDRAHPQREVVESALSEVERLERQASGNEQRELHAAAGFLREDLRLHRNGGRGMTRNAGAGDYLPQHLRHIEFRYHDAPEESGDSVRYGDFEGTRHAGGGEPEPGEWYEVNLASGSDYSGGSVTESNFRVLEEMLEESHPRGSTPPVWATARGGHGTYALLVVWDRLDEEIQEALNSLDDHVLLSDDDHSALEIDQQDEAWEDWGKKDFLEELVAYLNGYLATQGDEEIKDEDELGLSDDETFALFRIACEVGNHYWEDQQGAGQWIDMDEVGASAAALITNEKEIPGWAASSHNDGWDAIEKVRGELDIKP